MLKWIVMVWRQWVCDEYEREWVDISDADEDGFGSEKND